MSSRARLLLDGALFLAFALASQPAWTGISAHEWLAVVVALPALYHLAINWEWVVRTAARLPAKIKTLSGANLAVDSVLFLATVTVMISGVMLLPGVITFSDGGIARGIWLSSHKISSNIILLSMLAHLMLHVRWVAETIERHALPRPGRHAVGQVRLRQERVR